ncbi:MAG: twin-arginine translocase TatA/TatE family subunit [Actinomycetes bacterium]
MVGSIFSPEVLIILIVVIGLLLGAKRIPQMARSLGSAKREFEKGLKDGDKGEPDAASQASTEPKQD